jgi:hypothetical protein
VRGPLLVDALVAINFRIVGNLKTRFFHEKAVDECGPLSDVKRNRI